MQIPVNNMSPKCAFVRVQNRKVPLPTYHITYQKQSIVPSRVLYTVREGLVDAQELTGAS